MYLYYIIHLLNITTKFIFNTIILPNIIKIIMISGKRCDNIIKLLKAVNNVIL